MKKIALFLAVVMLLSIPTVGLAEEGAAVEAAEGITEMDAATENQAAEAEELPDAGITPDSWLYGLDKFMKELRLLITFDAAEKAGLLDRICSERLAEAKEMVATNKARYGMIAMKAYKAVLEKLVEVLDDAIVNETDLDSVLKQFTSNQLEREKLAAIILEEMPEELRDEMERQLQDIRDELDVTIEVTDYEPDTEDTGEAEADPDGNGMDETDHDDADTENKDETEIDDVNTEENDAAEGDSGDSTEEPKEGEETNQDAEASQDEKDEPEDEAEDEEKEGNHVAPVLPLKKQIIVKVLEEKVSPAAAQLYANGELNLRQVMAVCSLAKQTGKTFDEVLNVFLENGKGIGAASKALGLYPKRALKGLKGVYKGIKKQIMKECAEARKDLKKIKSIENPKKAEIPDQKAIGLKAQAPVREEMKDDTNKAADRKAVQKAENKKLNILNTSKIASGNRNSCQEKDKTLSKDDNNRKDNEDNNGSKTKNGGNNWNSRNNKKTKASNQSYHRSDRAKERTNRR